MPKEKIKDKYIDDWIAEVIKNKPMVKVVKDKPIVEVIKKKPKLTVDGKERLRVLSFRKFNSLSPEEDAEFTSLKDRE